MMNESGTSPSTMPPGARSGGVGRRLLALVVALGVIVLSITIALVPAAGPSSAQGTAAHLTAAHLTAVHLAAATTVQSVRPATCSAGTCWVAVNVATLWVNPSDPRPVDRPALANPADPRAWIAAMTVAQKSWLVGRLETQALYGTKVTVIGHHGAGWTKVAIPGQPTNRDRRGYPGWVPTRQLTSTPLVTATTYAVVRWRAAWLWSSWSSRGMAGTRVMQVSYDTMLPVVHATSAYVEVTLIGGTQLALSRKVVALHVVRASWGATRAKVVAEAKRFLGLQYLWAGMSGFGYDCSGFTYSVYQAFGITLSRDADQQAVHGTPVALRSLLPGDLVFFRGSPAGPITHVGMYVGNGNMIDAPHTGAAVRIEPVSSFGIYAGARRYLSR